MLLSLQGSVPQVFITKIKNSFFDSLYYLLDGLVHLAFSDDEPLLMSEFDPESGAARHNDKVSPCSWIASSKS
jgi:hypothetical protein